MSDSDSEDRDLASFMAKVDEIGTLVHDLSSSSAPISSSEALRNADSYLQQLAAKTKPPKAIDRTIVNKTVSETAEFCRALEEDAQDRAKQRRQRETAGKEHRRQGTQAFRRGEFPKAIEHFSKAIHEMPWVIPLYTNRALCSNKLGRYEEVIQDCDKALRFEPQTVRAHVYKGKALTEMGSYSQAVECFSMALKLNPDNVIRLEIMAAMEMAQEQIVTSPSVSD